MSDEAIKLGGKKKSKFIDKVKEILPEGGNLNLCLTCGACSSGCPATGLEDMDPRKFLRMAALGMDDEILIIRMGLDVHHVSAVHLCMPDEDRYPPAGFQRAGQLAAEKAQRDPGLVRHGPAHDTCSAMGLQEEDWQFVVEDVAEEVREAQPGI
jgi:ferredoxin